LCEDVVADGGGCADAVAAVADYDEQQQREDSLHFGDKLEGRKSEDITDTISTCFGYGWLQYERHNVERRSLNDLSLPAIKGGGGWECDDVWAT
jgi:hypothetical protein